MVRADDGHVVVFADEHHRDKDKVGADKVDDVGGELVKDARQSHNRQRVRNHRLGVA